MKSLLVLFLLSTGLFFVNENPVPFTLRNESVKSIPLRIPGVMNPNLSPMSNSGVRLKVGQKIFFYHKRKKYLLLEVKENLRDTKVKVSKLISERKKELNLR